ncbi:MAG TPA: HAMP domain-containing sensor histidine kinase, partial [Algoriphagus sp.]|nr:HAMP domain-containing sensor histidine kinase [Algoriphagus sp.]
EEAAEVFTDSGIDSEEIHHWVKKLTPNKVDTWLNWIQFLLQTQALVSNIKNATEGISRLIGAVKSYTHMDQAPVKTDVDLSKGIKDTLAILAHKIKASHVEVIFPKPESPITVFGFPGELNQIWTNLIDNAIDAMEVTKSPKLEIRIIPTKNTVSVEITDNGPGIPSGIKSKIFDPFFTTKGMGKGTGMGLDLVNQIVNKHEGKIQVDSTSGQTTFKVEFPKN